MNVYLVPAGPSRFALYSEVVAPAAPPGATESTKLWGRITAAFRRAVDEGEAEASGARSSVDPSRSKLRRLITRKIAEAVAEQRLLWTIRHETKVGLVHPERLPAGQAVDIARAEFAADAARHRRWLVIDALIVAVTGPVFFFVPGPNIVSWYFTFRAVGHYFSMKGARRGLTDNFFVPEPNGPLSDVADALSLPPDARDRRVEAAAAALGLERLPVFVRRIADRAV